MPNAPVPAAATGLPPLLRQTAPTEHEALYGLPPSMTRRRLVEAVIERLIGLLDRLDPDPDREPSLGAGGCHGAPVDIEGDHADDEPSLGAPENASDQRFWGQGAADEREATGTIDDEPMYVGGFGRTMSESRALEEAERQLLALAARVRRRNVTRSRQARRAAGMKGAVR